MRIPLHLIPIIHSWLILSPTAPAAPSLEEAWAALPGYTYGADRAPLVVLETHVWETAAKGDSAQRLQLGRRLADVLAGAATTPDARRFACQQLAIVGGAGEVPALAKWIDDARMGDAAILALARIPAPEAGAALRGALATSSGSVRTSVIAALGQRREVDAVPALRQLAAGADRAVGDAAAAALALIGGKPAATALTELLSQAEAPRPALIDACLGVADGLAAAGEQEAAVALYRRLYAEPMPSLARAAALRGLAACEGAELRTQLWQALAGPDVEAARVAAECLPQLPAEPDGAALQQRLLSAPLALQVILLAGLGRSTAHGCRPRRWLRRKRAIRCSGCSLVRFGQLAMRRPC
ncbi:HEAT repeat domain-containing protein [bacterium]|nr:HEAT repeat domain-containing protein [bacterium]